MRILTWNLWWRHGPWQQRQAAIATVLAEAAPDLCGLQEVWAGPEQNQAADLAARLGMHWCWAPAPVRPRHDADLLIGNAVLSRWPITTTERIALPVGELPVEGRVAVHARVRAPGGALPFFSTHLTYLPGGSAVRTAQVRTLAAAIAAHTAGCAYPPVLTGDFNAEPDSDELRLLGGLHTAPAVPGLVLLDAWRYADPADPGHTWDLRNGYQAASALPSCRIDYIMVGLPVEGRGRVRAVRLAGTAPVDGVWPSDHFAVVADLAG